MMQQQQQPVTIDAVMALLRDGAMRRFRIDIEADSTIVGDESQEKKDRVEFIQSMTQFVTAWAPLIQANPALGKLAGDMMLFGVRAFRVGRELEESIEDTVERIEDAANQPPPPNPQMQTEQIKADAQKEKSQAEILKAKMDAEQAMMEHHISMRQAQMDEQRAQQDFYRQQAQAANQAMMPQGPQNV